MAAQQTPQPISKISPTFGPAAGIEDQALLTPAPLGSPFPDAPRTASSASDPFRPPSAVSAGTSTDRNSQLSGQSRLPVQGTPVTVSSSVSSHQRGTSTSSVSSFSGEASLIGAQNIGSRRRSSTLAARILPPTSVATPSPGVPASARSSVMSGTGAANGGGVSAGPGHARVRSGSVDGTRSIDSVQRGVQSPQMAVQKPLAEASNGEPMNLAGNANQYGVNGVRARPGHVQGSSGSSHGHQRYGSATATQLSFDPANGRIRVGPSVPNAYTFVPFSPNSGPPPVVMTHSASGTLTAPVIDSPQSPPVVPNAGLRQNYASGDTSQAHGQNMSIGPAPFQGPVPMMQMSPQPTGAMSATQSPTGQTFAGMHRQRLSNKGSNGSLNRNASLTVLSGTANAIRPSSTSSSNGGVKTPTSSAGVGAASSGFSPSNAGSTVSTGQRSPYNYAGHSASPATLSREPSDASHASRWAKPGQQGGAGAPPNAYPSHSSGTSLAKRPSELSLSSSLAAHATNAVMTPPAIGHHSSNPSISSSIRGTPASTTVLTASAIAARNAQNYGPQYHRTRARSNSGSSAVPNGSSSIHSPTGLGLAGFFTPSPPTTPGSPAIHQVMGLQAQQNVAAQGGFRSAATAAQAATAGTVTLPASAGLSQRRPPPGPVNPPGFSFPARGSTSQDTARSTDFYQVGAGPHATQGSSRSENADTVRDTDQKSIRSVSDINASSEDEARAPNLGRMSTGEDVWATVARNTSMKRNQNSGKSNTPGSRSISSRPTEGGVVRKRSRDLLSANTAEASIPLHTDSSVLTAEQLVEIQTALARSESQRSNSRAGAPSRQAFSPPPVPAIPDSISRTLDDGGGSAQPLRDLQGEVTSPLSPTLSTPFFSPREELSQSSAMQSFEADQPTLGLNFANGTQPAQPPVHTRLQSSEALQAVTSTPPGPAAVLQSAPATQTPATHIAARVPVLASSFKSEVMYDVTTSHRPTSPTFSHRSKRSDLPSLLDLTTQSNTAFRSISPVHDLDEHALSLSQAIDEANARQVEFTFPAMTDRGHRRGNSSIDSRFSGRAALPGAFQASNISKQPEAIKEESYDVDNVRVSSSSRSAPRRSKSHDQLTNVSAPRLEEPPKSAASEAHANLGPRVLDDVAAQTRAATRALKGPEENASLAVPKRSRTLSKRKSQKKLNKIISQPSLITTSQRLDHAVDIKTPDVWLMRSHTHNSHASSSNTGEKQYGSVRNTPKSEINGKTLHRRHSSSFGHSGEFKERWAQSAQNGQGSTSGQGSGVSFPAQSPATPSGSTNFGSRILGKLRARKRTGEQSFFEKFTSPNTAAKSTTALTKSPASSFGHATLGPEPMTMMGEADPTFSRDPDPFRSEVTQGGGSTGLPVNDSASAYSAEGQRTARNMSQADRENRLRLVSALSFGSPLDQTITESIGAHLGALPEENSETAQPTKFTPFAEANPGPAMQSTPTLPAVDSVSKVNDAQASASTASQLMSPPQARIPRSATGQTLDGTKSARDTIVRRTIIIPTDSNYDKRKSAISIAAKRKSRAVKPADEKDMTRNIPPSPEPQLPRSSSDVKVKRESVRKSLQDRPPTPPGPAGVGGLHRRKISADMLADQPLPKPANDIGASVPASSSLTLGQKRGLGVSPSLASLLVPGNNDKLAPPLPSPATTSIYSQGNGSLYDFYMNDDGDAEEEDNDDDDDDGGGRMMEPSQSMDNSMRNHIEITERADGSVVWQVIAGLADRSSVYSEDPRLSYLSGGSRTRESMFFRGARVESVYVPEPNDKTVSGLDAEDSRSFFTPKRAGHRKSFSYDNPPVPPMPSAFSSSELTAQSGEQLAEGAEGRPSLQQSDQSTSKQFNTPIGFDMATSSGPSTRIVYTNDSDLAQLLESFAQGKDSAKFDFIRSDQGGPSPVSERTADQSRQRVEAEIYTLLNSQSP
ncbi:hypothetical protein OC834_007152 [Tilletia horrida]|nr:hypothetical protein OC834_007152 [Tilletia horrida]